MMHTSLDVRGACASTSSTSVGLTFTPPRDHEVLLAVDHAHAPPSSISPTSPVCSQPSASSTSVGLLGVEAVAAHHHRAAHEDLAVGARAAASAPAIGTPSSAQPPHVSVMPYASTTRTPSASARARSAGGQRRAADDHAPVLVQRRAGVEQAPQRRRHERHDRRALRRAATRATRSMSKPSCTVHGDAGDVRARERRRGWRRGGAAGTRASDRRARRRARRSSRGPSPPCPRA